MILQPFDVVVIAWLVLAILSAAYVAGDQFRGNPEPAVMKWGFVLVTLYMGPIGLLLYVLADKEPRPGTHERFVKPLWKQGIGSTVHCIAGDATGIIVAAVVVAVIGIPMWQDLIIEYVAGFLFGLLIFQALFMRTMMGGSYWRNVRSSFVPELLSMNLMMAGMAPTMAFLMMGRDMRAMWPAEPQFWFVMSLGVTVGFFVAYPVNVWLVSRGLKHGLMTVRATPDDHGEHAGHEHAHDAHDEHEMETQDLAHAVTRPQLVAMTGVTLLALVAGMYVPSTFVNMNLSAHDVGGIIMPPGMIMTSDTPAEAMRDMAAVDPRDFRFHADEQAEGARTLNPTLEAGVKVFQLEVSLGQ